MSKHRPNLSLLVQIFADAAMAAIAASADAFAHRWKVVSGKRVEIVLGNTSVEIPQIATEPDAFPYPKRLKFQTKIKCEVDDTDMEIVSNGAVFRALAQDIDVQIVFSFGAVPEGYALMKEKANAQISNNLDQISNETR